MKRDRRRHPPRDGGRTSTEEPAPPEQIFKAVKPLPSKKISVVIVEDHRMFREQLANLVDKADDMRVCGQTDNIRDGFALIAKERPSIAIIDITLKGSSGLELLKDLRAHELAVPALVLSMHDESLYAERALRAGARGYLTKHEASAVVMRAIRQVLSGEIYLNPRFMSRMVKGIISGRGTGGGPMDCLADRELEVFELIGRGLMTREIARQLGLGITTVDTYRARIKEKLNLENFARLRVVASRNRNAFLSFGSVTKFFWELRRAFSGERIKETTGSTSKRVAVGFGAGQGARVHGRDPM